MQFCLSDIVRSCQGAISQHTFVYAEVQDRMWSKKQSWSKSVHLNAFVGGSVGSIPFKNKCSDWG